MTGQLSVMMSGSGRGRTLINFTVIVVIILAPLQGQTRQLASLLAKLLPECHHPSLLLRSWRSVLLSINYQAVMSWNEWSIIRGMHKTNRCSCKYNMKRLTQGHDARRNRQQESTPLFYKTLSVFFEVEFTCSNLLFFRLTST